MNFKVNKILISLILILIVCPVLAGNLWQTDLGKSIEIAKASNKYIILDFTGSDWCGWCIKLEKEVFSTKEFMNYADQHLVCMLVDFPYFKPQNKSLKDRNHQLARQFQVRGYPTIVILSPDGQYVGSTGYRRGGVHNYIKHLNQIIEPHRKANKVPEPVALNIKEKVNQKPKTLDKQNKLPAINSEIKESENKSTKIP